MRLLFVAPGAVPPLTEGRKLLIVDLAKALEERGVEVEVLTGGQAGWPGAAVWKTLRSLRYRCRSRDSVDAALVFPYGTFKGVRRLVNGNLVRWAHHICAQVRLPCIPVFYSCSGLSLEALAEKFGPAFAVGVAARGIIPIRFGVHRRLLPWQPRGAHLQSALFLCGYQRATPAAYDSVLNERGLIDVLRAGDQMAGNGIRLTVAIPFLRHSEARSWLSRLAGSLCPSLEMAFEEEVESSEAFLRHDVFLFPYREAHSVFVPTSLLEAMSVGIPVLASDQSMYRSLTMDGTVSRCGLHRVGDAGDLGEELADMAKEYDAALDRAKNATDYVRVHWTVDECADQILEGLRSGMLASSPEPEVSPRFLA